MSVYELGFSTNALDTAAHIALLDKNQQAYNRTLGSSDKKLKLNKLTTRDLEKVEAALALELKRVNALIREQERAFAKATTEEVRNSIARTTTAYRQQRQEIMDGMTAVRQAQSAAGKTTGLLRSQANASVELARTVNDLQVGAYGGLQQVLIAVSNNMEGVGREMGKLVTKGAGWRANLKSILGVFKGPGGLILLVNIAMTALVFFGDRIKKAMGLASEESKKAEKAVDSLLNSIIDINNTPLKITFDAGNAEALIGGAERRIQQLKDQIREFSQEVSDTGTPIYGIAENAGAKILSDADTKRIAALREQKKLAKERLAVAEDLLTRLKEQQAILDATSAIQREMKEQGIEDTELMGEINLRTMTDEGRALEKLREEYEAYRERALGDKKKLDRIDDAYEKERQAIIDRFAEKRLRDLMKHQEELRKARLLEIEAMFEIRENEIAAMEEGDAQVIAALDLKYDRIIHQAQERYGEYADAVVAAIHEARKREAYELGIDTLGEEMKRQREALLEGLMFSDDLDELMAPIEESAEGVSETVLREMYRTIGAIEAAMGQLEEMFAADPTVEGRRGIRQLIEMLGALKVAYEETAQGTDTWADRVAEANKKMEEASRQGAEAVMEAAIAGSIAAAIQGDSAKGVVAGIFDAAATMLGQLGKIALMTAMGIKGIKEALTKLEPGPALIAGVTLIAFSAAMRHAAQQLGDSGGGSSSSSYRAQASTEVARLDLGGARVSGARASGGRVSKGARYLVGERGPEVVEMGAPGYVFPNASSRAPMPGRAGSGQVKVTTDYSVDVIDVETDLERFSLRINKRTQVREAFLE